MPMTPQELTLLVTAVANSLYGCMSALELAVLASVFTQLGDTLETLAAQKALQDARCAETQGGADFG
ncbi:MAG: hypothetical protein K2P26_10395 [Oscillospiraceae bacterium]|nr:hypothetical protein [Oscillospiraceae bacterium]MDE6936008.1 hypothetical protein [Oscillospiraceae bacterium]